MGVKRKIIFGMCDHNTINIKFSPTIIIGIDPSNLQNSLLVNCLAPDPSSSSWYIQRYGTGTDSFDGIGARLTLNDSFLFNHLLDGLNIQNVTKFSEGTYRCGLNTSASLCLFVRGKHN